MELKDIDAVRIMIDHGANMNAAGGAPLITCTTTGDIEMVRLLVGRGADINVANCEGGVCKVH